MTDKSANRMWGTGRLRGRSGIPDRTGGARGCQCPADQVRCAQSPRQSCFARPSPRRYAPTGTTRGPRVACPAMPRRAASPPRRRNRARHLRDRDLGPRPINGRECDAFCSCPRLLPCCRGDHRIHFCQRRFSSRPIDSDGLTKTKRSCRGQLPFFSPFLAYVHAVAVYASRFPSATNMPYHRAASGRSAHC